MQITVLKCKLHRACVTHSELEYEGSCAIDRALLIESGIYEYEQVHIYNVNNGQRFTTYAIAAEAGSGIISINGAAAHKARPKDRIIICAYMGIEESCIAAYKPNLVYLSEANNVIKRRSYIAEQIA